MAETELRPSVTSTLVPVSTKINIFEFKFTTFFQENLSGNLSRKFTPRCTEHCWG